MTVATPLLRLRRWRICALLVSVAALSMPTTAGAADPVSFASTSGTCTAGTNTQFNGPTQSAAHSDVLVRVTLTGTATGEAWAGFSDYTTFGPDDGLWLHVGSVAAGSA